jgi:hypothetical protein
MIVIHDLQANINLINVFVHDYNIIKVIKIDIYAILMS